ncbi:MAG: ATP-binding cassette domain-containing protein [Methanobacteriaceae archaeon]|nr:ATP-binding cassette domain-containing protein [Methanobacteriaceae archaeon]
MKYAIETNNLTKVYDNGFKAVNELNLNVENKTIAGILGPNGAGKTTTIKMLTCIIQKTSGSAKVAGYDITKEPNQVREEIGMVPQLVSLYEDLTVRENVELCADFYGLKPDTKEKRIEDLMELVDIKYAENKFISQLSGGMKQKTSVVASLVHRPQILFLDEPTVGLDPTTKRVLWDLMEDLNEKGHTIILCSHDMYEVDKICDTLSIINQGTLAVKDTPQGLKDSLLENKKENNSIIRSMIQDLEQDEDEDHKEEIESLKASITNEDEEITAIVTNITEEMINDLETLDTVKYVEQVANGRITLALKKSENSVNKVITTILRNNGNIASIKTNDPTLEDVFINLTAKKRKEIKN